MTTALTPAEAYAALIEGNRRFIDGEMLHPSQSIDRRAELSGAQSPFAVLFGCSDSRVAAEIIFDRGLGDMFVVRTAGHVVDTTVVGSIEFGVDILGSPLIVVLGHDSCGAVAGAREAMVSGDLPSGLVRAIIDRVVPSIVTRAPSHALGSDSAPGEDDPFEITVPSRAELGREHVRETVKMLGTYSYSLAQGVKDGTVAIVGMEYTLSDGQAHLVEYLGDIGI